MTAIWPGNAVDDQAQALLVRADNLLGAFPLFKIGVCSVRSFFHGSRVKSISAPASLAKDASHIKFSVFGGKHSSNLGD
jgi:hypothetical protein